jgi:hypothetical protein
MGCCCCRSAACPFYHDGANRWEQDLGFEECGLAWSMCSLGDLGRIIREEEFR